MSRTVVSWPESTLQRLHYTEGHSGSNFSLPVMYVKIDVLENWIFHNTTVGSLVLNLLVSHQKSLI